MEPARLLLRPVLRRSERDEPAAKSFRRWSSAGVAYGVDRCRFEVRMPSLDLEKDVAADFRDETAGIADRAASMISDFKSRDLI